MMHIAQCRSFSFSFYVCPSFLFKSLLVLFSVVSYILSPTSGVAELGGGGGRGPWPPQKILVGGPKYVLAPPPQNFGRWPP